MQKESWMYSVFVDLLNKILTSILRMVTKSLMTDQIACCVLLMFRCINSLDLLTAAILENYYLALLPNGKKPLAMIVLTEMREAMTSLE